LKLKKQPRAARRPRNSHTKLVPWFKEAAHSSLLPQRSRRTSGGRPQPNARARRDLRRPQLVGLLQRNAGKWEVGLFEGASALFLGARRPVVIEDRACLRRWIAGPRDSGLFGERLLLPLFASPTEYGGGGLVHRYHSQPSHHLVAVISRNVGKEGKRKRGIADSFARHRCEAHCRCWGEDNSSTSSTSRRRRHLYENA